MYLNDKKLFKTINWLEVTSSKSIKKVAIVICNGEVCTQIYTAVNTIQWEILKWMV